jgi:protein-tyrosine phosphatase
MDIRKQMKFNQLSRCSQLALLACSALASAAANAQQLPDPGHVSRIPFDMANVTSPDGHVFVISWHAARVHHVRIFAGTDPTDIGSAHEVADGTGTGHVTVSNLPAEPRWYFKLVPNRGDPLVVADRSLHLTTAANFRDAGGYRSANGRWVRMGLAYRSNGIEHLTDDELAQVDKLNIKLVCDLRTVEEAHRGPDRVPKDAADVSADVLADDADLIHTMIAGGGAQNGSAARQNAVSRHELEQRVYRDFVRLASARKAYRLLFERIADPAALPTIFHCTAGKDRTGWAEAVFLMILGVPRATIVQDYELTNDYLRGDALKSVRESMSQSTPTRMVADPSALDAAFDEVMTDYGSFDSYLSQGLHLSDATLAAIRKIFLAG